MTCMNYYPRSATVRAETDCMMLEMLRNVLDVLQRASRFARDWTKPTGARALDSHLRDVSIFRGLKQDFIDHLRDRVELLHFAPGQAICRRGAPPTVFLLVRLGFVKASENYPGGELVSRICRAATISAKLDCLAEGRARHPAPRLTTLQVVRIFAEDFRAMVEMYPEIRSGLERAAPRAPGGESGTPAQNGSQRPSRRFSRAGLMAAQSLLVWTSTNARARRLVTACADARRVTRLVREGLRFENFLVGRFGCRQCPIRSAWWAAPSGDAAAIPSR